MVLCKLANSELGPIKVSDFDDPRPLQVESPAPIEDILESGERNSLNPGKSCP